MKITVRTSKLESLDFEATSWTVDEPGYLWINDGVDPVATFAPGEWKHVMTAVEA